MYAAETSWPCKCASLVCVCMHVWVYVCTCMTVCDLKHFFSVGLCALVRMLERKINGASHEDQEKQTHISAILL